jgi:hypothetical protein
MIVFAVGMSSVRIMPKIYEYFGIIISFIPMTTSLFMLMLSVGNMRLFLNFILRMAN